jgi:hypothetical protein
MEKIEFYNRDGSEVWIEKIGEEGWWQLRMKPDQLFSYTHLLYEDEGQGIYAVDPPGGPFLSVGTKIGERYMIEEIKNTSMGIFLRLKPLYIE